MEPARSDDDKGGEGAAAVATPTELTFSPGCQSREVWREWSLYLMKENSTVYSREDLLANDTDKVTTATPTTSKVKGFSAAFLQGGLLEHCVESVLRDPRTHVPTPNHEATLTDLLRSALVVDAEHTTPRLIRLAGFLHSNSPPHVVQQLIPHIVKAYSVAKRNLALASPHEVEADKQFLWDCGSLHRKTQELTTDTQYRELKKNSIVAKHVHDVADRYINRFWRMYQSAPGHQAPATDEEPSRCPDSPAGDGGVLPAPRQGSGEADINIMANPFDDIISQCDSNAEGLEIVAQAVNAKLSEHKTALADMETTFAARSERFDSVKTAAASTVHTLAAKRDALSEEKAALLKRLSEIDDEVAAIDAETVANEAKVRAAEEELGQCEALVGQMKDDFSKQQLTANVCMATTLFVGGLHNSASDFFHSIWQKQCERFHRAVDCTVDACCEHIHRREMLMATLQTSFNTCQVEIESPEVSHHRKQAALALAQDLADGLVAQSNAAQHELRRIDEVLTQWQASIYFLPETMCAATASHGQPTQSISSSEVTVASDEDKGATFRERFEQATNLVDDLGQQAYEARNKVVGWATLYLTPLVHNSSTEELSRTVGGSTRPAKLRKMRRQLTSSSGHSNSSSVSPAPAASSSDASPPPPNAATEAVQHRPTSPGVPRGLAVAGSYGGGSEDDLSQLIIDTIGPEDEDPLAVLIKDLKDFHQYDDVGGDTASLVGSVDGSRSHDTGSITGGAATAGRGPPSLGTSNTADSTVANWFKRNSSAGSASFGATPQKMEPSLSS